MQKIVYSCTTKEFYCTAKEKALTAKRSKLCMFVRLQKIIMMMDKCYLANLKINSITYPFLFLLVYSLEADSILILVFIPDHFQVWRYISLWYLFACCYFVHWKIKKTKISFLTILLRLHLRSKEIIMFIASFKHVCLS